MACDPSSHQAPSVFGDTSPALDWLNPATNPSAAVSSDSISFSNSHAATPLLSPATCVLLLWSDVPWTANQFSMPMLRPSDARWNRIAVIVLSTVSAYLSRSCLGLRRYADGERLIEAYSISVVPTSR